MAVGVNVPDDEPLQEGVHEGEPEVVTVTDEVHVGVAVVEGDGVGLYVEFIRGVGGGPKGTGVVGVLKVYQAMYAPLPSNSTAIATSDKRIQCSEM